MNAERSIPLDMTRNAQTIPSFTQSLPKRLEFYSLGGTPHPVIVSIIDNYCPLIFLLYHYCRVGDPPNLFPLGIFKLHLNPCE